MFRKPVSGGGREICMYLCIYKQRKRKKRERGKDGQFKRGEGERERDKIETGTCLMFSPKVNQSYDNIYICFRWWERDLYVFKYI